MIKSNGSLEAIQKRAGKGTHHRRQQSGTVPATQESGLAPPPPSEGDSARTINGNAASGARDGNTYQATQRAVTADQQVMAFSSPPSAFSTPRKGRRRATPSRRERRNYPVTGESPRGTEVRDSDATRSSDEETDYEPPTYRTRRRSASVASVYHYEDGDVDERGVVGGRKSAQRKGLTRGSSGEGRRAGRLARKIASMGSLFHADSWRLGLSTETRIQRSEEDRTRVRSSDPSSPSSPVTPRDLLPSDEEPDARASLKAMPLPFWKDEPGLEVKLDGLALQQSHNRTRSLGLQGVW